MLLTEKLSPFPGYRDVRVWIAMAVLPTYGGKPGAAGGHSLKLRGREANSTEVRSQRNQVLALGDDIYVIRNWTDFWTFQLQKLINC